MRGTGRADPLPHSREDPARLIVTLIRRQLFALLAGAGTNDIQLDGDETILATIVSLTDEPDRVFAIVTP